jgi:hypothetical protein
MAKSFTDVLKWDEHKHPRDKHGLFTMGTGPFGHTPDDPKKIVQVYGLSDFPEDAPPDPLEPKYQTEERAEQAERRSQRIHLTQESDPKLPPMGSLTTNTAAKQRGIERRKKRKEKAARMAEARRKEGGVVGAKQRALDFRMAQGRAQQKIIRAIRERKDD